jgi:hypothetical protein
MLMTPKSILKNLLWKTTKSITVFSTLFGVIKKPKFALQVPNFAWENYRMAKFPSSFNDFLIFNQLVLRMVM